MLAKEIKLTQGKIAIVDAEDYDMISQYKWYAKKGTQTYYASRNLRINEKKRITQRMHRLIMKTTDPTIEIDHVNGNGLDNRKCNLRLATRRENGENRNKNYNTTSGYKGVRWNKYKQKWQARIVTGGKERYIGHFENIIDAAIAYNQAATKYFGQFARPNVIREG